MPLFVCMNCHAVENTALSSYFAQEVSAYEAGEVFSPLCSECKTGTWHGQFPKNDVCDTHYVPDGPFLKHKAEML